MIITFALHHEFNPWLYDFFEAKAQFTQIDPLYVGKSGVTTAAVSSRKRTISATQGSGGIFGEAIFFVRMPSVRA